ncbi:MAG TPA: DUF4383 domain-containing protein [Pseudolysinimonas sp.]|jgi:hypothetical protein|nr:DUF4383 domain-containing protein [Pseudolysinimonas sp.]
MPEAPRVSGNRITAVATGVAYLVLAAAETAVTAPAGQSLVDRDGALLLGVMQVNLLLAVVHAVLGVALIGAGIAGLRVAQFVNGAVGAIFLGLGLTGLFISGTEANVLAINGAGNVLHLGTSVLLLAVGLGAERGSRPSAP